MKHTRFLAIAGIALLVACGGGGSTGSVTGVGGGGGGGGAGGGGGGAGGTGGGGGTGGSSSNAITVGDDFFSPTGTTVPVGTTVNWTWTGSQPHDVTFDDGAHSDTQTSGGYSRTFSTAGNFKYHCTVHGATMSGAITVQ
jgi:plastocyanin